MFRIQKVSIPCTISSFLSKHKIFTFVATYVGNLFLLFTYVATSVGNLFLANFCRVLKIISNLQI